MRMPTIIIDIITRSNTRMHTTTTIDHHMKRINSRDSPTTATFLKRRPESQKLPFNEGMTPHSEQKSTPCYDGKNTSKTLTKMANIIIES
mmetsp:Transcript_17798/g.42853  ORF Transcript_17798/g.42853 Transcript_17798/m.42853 type:complete len:90 (+) Transcript_17798:843-1112(+)